MSGMKPWFVYVLLNGDHVAYTGIAVDLDARLARHNRGRGARFTRGRGPWELVYAERYTDKPAALRREMQIKRNTALKNAIKNYFEHTLNKPMDTKHLPIPNGPHP